MTPKFRQDDLLAYTRTDGGVREGRCLEPLDLDLQPTSWPKERHCRYVYRLDVEGVGWRTVCECRLRKASPALQG